MYLRMASDHTSLHENKFLNNDAVTLWVTEYTVAAQMNDLLEW